MAKGQVVHAGHTDPNQNASAIGVIGTLGTADTKGSALTLPAAVDADSGAWFTKQIGGTVEALPDPLGSVVVTVGTIGDLDTIGTLGVIEGGTVAEVSLISALPDPVGSVTMTVGTVTVLPDLPGGTIDELTTGTVAVSAIEGDIAGGTIDSVGELVKGTVTNVAQVDNIAKGTVQVDSKPVRTGTSYGTLGTAGAAAWGTLIAGAGAGTRVYVEGLSIVVHDGTVDCAITNVGIDGTTGVGVLARGKFVPGGGIARDFTNIQQSGTGGTLGFWMGGAGTAYFQINYYHV